MTSQLLVMQGRTVRHSQTLRLQEYVHSGSCWAVGNSGSARGDGDLIGNVDRGFLLAGHNGGGEEGSGDDGETHLDYWVVFFGW